MQFSRTSLFFAPLVILCLFGPTLIGTERLAFRDVSHFYTPLYDYIAARTSQQWLPLWNPLDQTGIPLVGETSTAVLYPVRYLLFSLPITTETALAWYVVLHLILASITARIAAHWSGLGPQGATLVSLLYPLSGSLLFLYANPPFLVSAAWMPLVLGVMLSRQSIDDRSRIAIAAPAMAMMILGGDPQMALNTMIVIGVFFLIQSFRPFKAELTLRSVIAVPVIAAILSAPQLAASVSWSRQSDRVTVNEASAWHEPPAVDSKHAESFQYSLAPWHIAELATPNAFGSLFPVYRRISNLMIGDGRMWTPSIYMGMITLVSLAIGLGSRQISLTDRWTSVAIHCLWLSMGHFGMVMVVQSVTGKLPNVDSAIGGPYWMLYQFVPGYDSFRYPAKWLPLFALGAAITVGGVVGKIVQTRSDWRLLAFIALSVLTIFGAVTALRFHSGWITDPMDRIRRDEFWGPIDLRGGLAQIQWSIVHSAAAMFSILLLTFMRLQSQTRMAALLIIVGLDLAIAGHGSIATVSRSRENALVMANSPQAMLAGSRWMRTQSGDGWPDAWKQTSCSDRMLDVEASLRISRFGRWHLENRIGMFNNMVSIQSQNMTEFWKAAESLTTSMSPAQRADFWKGIRGWLAIDGVVHLPTTAREVADGNRIAVMMDQRLSWSPHGTELRFFPGATAESVVAQNAQNFPSRLEDIVARSENKLIASGEVISDESAIYSGLKIVDAGVLVRPVFQDGHWVALYSASRENQWNQTTVFQVDRLTQGVVLPAGTWDVRFDYKPAWLIPSLVLAAVAWMGLIFWIRVYVPGSR